MSVARVTELSATSETGFEDAINQAVARATKTLRGVEGAWVKDQNVLIEDGNIKGYKVNVEVTFVLEEYHPTTPGGAGTTPRLVAASLRARPIGFSHRVGASPLSSGLLNALGRAFLTPLLAWPRFSYHTSSVPLRFAPLKRCAGASVVRSCPSPVGASTPRHQAQLQLPRVRHTGFSHRVGASMANGLRPLYCPWPRCFVYLPIAIGAALRSAPPQ